MTNPTLVLGSASPRRVDLLSQLGLPFDQVVSPDEEPPPRGSDAQAWAVDSASAKARAVDAWLAAGHGPASAQAQPRLVIGADTVVCCGADLLGKPEDDDDARRMLRQLSGREHTVCTGVVLRQGDRQWSAAEVTTVHVTPLSATAIDAYVASGEPRGKAGAYAIQGRGGRFVERVEGCYYNVVGLPLARLCALLQSAGYDLDPPREQE
jgi:septum formation protein